MSKPPADPVAALVEQALRAAAALPDETQQQTADAVGCSQSMVATIINKSCESQQPLIVPSWVTSKHMQAAFRKLPVDERERLEALPADLAEEADRDFTPLVEEARRAAAALLATGEREEQGGPLSE